MSLYLKYRPQNFKTVVGQDHITATLKNALKHNSATHAYLFCGPRGTGKTSLARIIAKSLNCLNLIDGSEPCNECESCQAILNGRLVDLIEIDAASNRGIDEIRELRDKILFAPTQGKVKVYIIDEVHMLTKEAFNALLKTLEEPPEHAYFILATTEFHKIPETIISRCQHFNLKRITQSDIVKRLQEIAIKENVQAEPDAIELIAKMASGGLRDAIGLFEQMNMDGAVIYQEVINNLGITGHMLIEQFFQTLIKKEASNAIKIINQINSQGQNLNQFCGELIAFLREQMLLGINNKENVNEIINFIDIFTEAKQQINNSLIPQLPLEVGVIKACNFEIKEKAVEVASNTAEASDNVVEAQDPALKAIVADEHIRPASNEHEIGELTLDEIRKNWQRIIENIETPFIRMSFMDSEPLKLEKDNLYLAFKSSTLMDKIANTKNQAEILKAFEIVFSIKITLHLEIKKISLKPMKDVEIEKEAPSVAAMAQEVFGS